jgi:hypothetical protein
LQEIAAARNARVGGKRNFRAFLGWRDPALLGRVSIPLCLTFIQSAGRIWAFPPRIASFPAQPAGRRAETPAARG